MRRQGLLALAVCGGVCAMSASAASASTGCDSVNSGALDSSTGGQTYSRTIYGLTKGEIVHIVFVKSDGLTSSFSYSYVASGGGGSSSGNFSSTLTVDHTMYVDATSSTFAISPVDSGAAIDSVSATCTPVASDETSGNDESAALRNAQINGSRVAATVSASAITSAVDAGIGAGFDGAPGVSIGPGSVTLNLMSGVMDRRRRVAKAFHALGIVDDDTPGAGDGTSYALAPESFWNVWANLKGSWLRGNSDTDGQQTNGIVGVGYKLTPDFLVGAYGGLETFDYGFEDDDAALTGTGGTVGAYAGWNVLRKLRLEGAAGWSRISYSARAGSTTGDFLGDRLMLSGKLTGTQTWGAYSLSPSAQVFANWEEQQAYTDSAGTLQDDASLYSGRMSLGGQAGRVFALSESVTLSPFAGLYGDWTFSGGDGVSSSEGDTGFEDGWSARVTGGVGIAAQNGLSLKLTGELGGIAADTQVLSATGRVSYSF